MDIEILDLDGNPTPYGWTEVENWDLKDNWLLLTWEDGSQRLFPLDPAQHQVEFTSGR